MLSQPLSLVLIVVGSMAQPLFAQVEVTGPIRFVGGEDQRRIDSIAPPLVDDAAITLSVAASGQLNWADVTVDGDTLLLTTDPPIAELVLGTALLRFIAPVPNQGPTWISADGHAPGQLFRTDGLPLQRGALIAGSMYEMIHLNGSWILVVAGKDECPPGSIPLGDRACMDQDAATGLGFYAAMDHCSDRGGKLCTWDEYFLGCTLLGAQLIGLFDEWEWLDDSANHTHTANQAGRFTCMSQRSTNGIPIFSGDARCCYHPR